MIVNIIIIALVAVIAIYGARKLVRKTKGEESCCGGGSGAKEFKPTKITDHDESHYPYVADYKVAGMSCDNCAKKVTNALDSIKGTWATVDLKGETAHVRSMNPIDEGAYKDVVSEAGYRIVGAA